MQSGTLQGFFFVEYALPTHSFGCVRLHEKPGRIRGKADGLQRIVIVVVVTTYHDNVQLVDKMSLDVFMGKSALCRLSRAGGAAVVWVTF